MQAELVEPPTPGTQRRRRSRVGRHELLDDLAEGCGHGSEVPAGVAGDRVHALHPSLPLDGGGSADLVRLEQRAALAVVAAGSGGPHPLPPARAALGVVLLARAVDHLLELLPLVPHEVRPVLRVRERHGGADETTPCGSP